MVQIVGFGSNLVSTSNLRAGRDDSSALLLSGSSERRGWRGCRCGELCGIMPSDRGSQVAMSSRGGDRQEASKSTVAVCLGAFKRAWQVQQFL